MFMNPWNACSCQKSVKFINIYNGSLSTLSCQIISLVKIFIILTHLNKWTPLKSLNKNGGTNLSPKGSAKWGGGIQAGLHFHSSWSSGLNGPWKILRRKYPPFLFGIHVLELSQTLTECLVAAMDVWCHGIPCPKCFLTEVAGDGNSLQMVCLYVVLQTTTNLLFSTHLTLV